MWISSVCVILPALAAKFCTALSQMFVLVFFIPLWKLLLTSSEGSNQDTKHQQEKETFSVIKSSSLCMQMIIYLWNTSGSYCIVKILLVTQATVIVSRQRRIKGWQNVRTFLTIAQELIFAWLGSELSHSERVSERGESVCECERGERREVAANKVANCGRHKKAHRVILAKTNL